jgi:hypothetical protein
VHGRAGALLGYWLPAYASRFRCYRFLYGLQFLVLKTMAAQLYSIPTWKNDRCKKQGKLSSDRVWGQDRVGFGVTYGFLMFLYYGLG